jgi:adenylyltransferase/sulfurtransferase
MPREIDVRQLADRLGAGEALYLLDVRQSWEHALASLPDSTLIPLNQLIARAGEISCPPSVPIIVYCHHGIRSMTAARVLEQRGFPEVYSLAGGIDAWSIEIDPTVPRY